MIDLMTIKAGTACNCRQGIVAEVTENMDDGMWVQVRLIEAPAGPTKSAPRALPCAGHRQGSDAPTAEEADQCCDLNTCRATSIRCFCFSGRAQDLPTLAKLLRRLPKTRGKSTFASAFTGATSRTTLRLVPAEGDAGDFGMRRSATDFAGS